MRQAADLNPSSVLGFLCESSLFGACVEGGLKREKAGPLVGRLEVLKASELAVTVPCTGPQNGVVGRIKFAVKRLLPKRKQL